MDKDLEELADGLNLNNTDHINVLLLAKLIQELRDIKAILSGNFTSGEAKQ